MLVLFLLKLPKWLFMILDIQTNAASRTGWLAEAPAALLSAALLPAILLPVVWLCGSGLRCWWGAPGHRYGTVQIL